MSLLAFTYSQLRVLLGQRDESGKSLEAFIAELASATTTMTSGAPRITRAEARALRTQRRNLGKLADLLHHWRQARKALRITSGKSALRIYGIDPKRLDLVAGDLPGQIAAHLSGAVPGLAEWTGPDDGAARILFDPKLTPRHRSVSDLTELPVLSPFAVMFLALQRPTSLLRWPSTFVQGWRQFGPAHGSLRRRIVSLVLLSMFLTGAHVLLRRAGGQVSMLCLTANSVFLEALRARVLAEPGGAATEVQHGIASPQFDPYFLSYRYALAGRDHGHLTIYPLLAPPFCLPAETTPRFTLSDQSSNSGIFRALVRVLAETGDRTCRPLNDSDIPALTEALAASTAPFCWDDTPVLAIFGGTDLGSDFYTGDAFRSEMALAQVLYGMLKEKGAVQLVYLPHPTNPPLLSITLPDGTPMPIFGESQQMYFCADYALSLYSSAIFEAGAMGAHAFSAMVPDTGVLHDGMLQAIFTPQDLTPGAITDCLSDIAARPCPGASDHKAKIAARLRRFFEGEI